MTNQQLLEIALQQSAYDCNCAPEDFLKTENVITLSKKHELARSNLPLPLECHLASYGNNIVAQVSERLYDAVNAYIQKYPAAHCFETPNLQALNDEVSKFGLKVCFMSEYFLPDLTQLKELPCAYETRLLHQPDFKNLYLEQWSNALCSFRKEHDILGVGAYDNGELIGFAACSDDSQTMYQIGIDVLPKYRRQGIASALTSRLALEILSLGKAPYYCAAWSNIRSVRNAIKSGFRPTWVELTVRTKEFVDQLNK